MVNGHESMTMPIDGHHGPVITAVTDGQFLAKFVVFEHFRLHFKSDLHKSKLYMMGRHESVIMLINEVTVW